MKTSIVIISYNTLPYTRLCIESIRQYTDADSYELIVVDNASSDGSVQWLQRQSDVIGIFNTQNEGFPKGCNQGIAQATGSDILLLNSDTIVTPRWLEQLRRALYSDERVGAVSCVANNCSNWQRVDAAYASIEEMESFAEQYNQTDSSKWERRLVLVGFCLLFKRQVYEKIGGLDEIFTPGNYEDDDYCLRMWQAGFTLLLCKDTFIHHFGGASFIQAEDPALQKKKQIACQQLAEKNRGIFQRKWGIRAGYKELSPAFLSLPPHLNPAARLLEIDCGCGFDLLTLERLCPQMQLSGIAVNRQEAEIAGWVLPTEFCEDVEQNVFAKLTGKYDYILLTNIVDTFKNPNGFLQELSAYVRPGGCIFTEQHIYEITAEKTDLIDISIIIAVWNGLTYTQQCLEAVRLFAGSIRYEIIVVDNGSTDGTREWLQSQMGIKVICNEGNKGTAAAWNQGIEASRGEHLLLLHNDVVLTQGALEAMNSMLLEQPALGAVAPVANRSYYVYQHVQAPDYNDFEGLQRFSMQISQREEKARQALFLEGFCLLLTREAVEKTGFFDEQYQQHSFEDMDYSFRLLKQGYKLAVAKNIYVHHEQGTFLQQTGAEKIREANQERLQIKWKGIRPGYSTCTKDRLLCHMNMDKRNLAVLDVGCSCGGNLMRIKELNPTAECAGIEIAEGPAAIARCFGEVRTMDLEQLDEAEWQAHFDYIIMGDILEHLRDPWQVIVNLKQMLKAGGEILASIPNVGHISTIYALLHGKWQYEEAGILDRTHLRFFTKQSVRDIMENAGLKVVYLGHSEEAIAAPENALKKELLALQNATVSEEELDAYQWEVVARK